jgi:hypothetical protein
MVLMCSRKVLMRGPLSMYHRRAKREELLVEMIMKMVVPPRDSLGWIGVLDFASVDA